MNISCVWEHNGQDSLIYAVELPGAYTRGSSKEQAQQKMAAEVQSYLRWKGDTAAETVEVTVVQEAISNLQIRDADSDVLFASEKAPLTREEYEALKALALKSAADFEQLYATVPDKDKAYAAARRTFYGEVPRTAEEMYRHTKSVNAYYFGEIDVPADNEGTILSCRERGFAALERIPGFLENPVILGSYGEEWSLRKLLRRFIWYDRIHAKAMYRMAVGLFGRENIPNIFCFQ